MKVTKQIKQRHEGIIKEIAKEVHENEKFIEGAISQFEMIKIKAEM
jgi:hypothetical protein